MDITLRYLHLVRRFHDWLQVFRRNAGNLICGLLDLGFLHSPSMHLTVVLGVAMDASCLVKTARTLPDIT